MNCIPTDLYYTTTIMEKKFQVTSNEKNYTPSNQSVKNVFKRDQLRQYKIQLVHELNEDSFDRRAEFWEGMMERCNNKNNHAGNILFSDEAT
ncbi:hypothetical protein NQ318_012837 [Aromia moschata]|uniref:Uncharacterized protein n=1 Tax=Aromia moschata TaxID=1265417 RepID=A0AAV8X8J6_9CUCU|nr:hypothetical protein NQ318_012837 [Aromia moschata]